ncbi:DUF6344 domain-containing protein [Streptomyces natalensis]|uniref:Secreted protein n=1 Tax=Streptomyces natalensis ATCC 27448 TaxID=1240678 RepID=A0A0D7CTC8_9ACTN|nr:DUF6344 domain-containing protein [Streptomyces natalensis]KIZ19514.1 hypothetical protein SNA_03080 [Streptomyces natalensis ATCC 27448]
MAAKAKVMKFWAACLAVLGKLLASLGVSAHASAARREATLDERAARPVPLTLARPRTERPASAPARVPLYGQLGYAQRTLRSRQLPPTIKQRLRAEAHGASPTSRSRLATSAEPLPIVPAGAVLHTNVVQHEIPAAIPAARRREYSACPA